ncbi:MAG: hypothetical protein ACR2I2_11885 [Bryobacteraceae bacterium]
MPAFTMMGLTPMIVYARLPVYAIDAPIAIKDNGHRPTLDKWRTDFYHHPDKYL